MVKLPAPYPPDNAGEIDFFRLNWCMCQLQRYKKHSGLCFSPATGSPLPEGRCSYAPLTRSLARRVRRSAGGPWRGCPWRAASGRRGARVLAGKGSSAHTAWPARRGARRRCRTGRRDAARRARLGRNTPGRASGGVAFYAFWGAGPVEPRSTSVACSSRLLMGTPFIRLDRA